MLDIEDLEELVQGAIYPLEDSRLRVKNLPDEVLKEDPMFLQLLIDARDLLMEAADIMYDAKKAAK